MPQAWTKRVTDEAAGRLDRLVKAQMKQTAEAKELDGWLMINLGSQLLRGDDLRRRSRLREELYTAYCTRASEQGRMPTA
jgi:oligopeptidase A